VEAAGRPRGVAEVGAGMPIANAMRELRWGPAWTRLPSLVACICVGKEGMMGIFN